MQNTALIRLCRSIVDPLYDSLLIVADSINGYKGPLAEIGQKLQDYAKYDAKLGEEVTLVPFKGVEGQKLVYAPTGSLKTDTADARNISEAACKGLKQLIALKCKRPLVVCGPMSLPKQEWTKKPYPQMCTLLGLCYAAYVPLEVRESVPEKEKKVEFIGVLEDENIDATLIERANAIECGRIIARDIGGSDPERMAPPKVAEYVVRNMVGTPCLSVEIDEVDSLQYPLMAAVNRAASVIDRHKGKVIKFVYEGAEPIEETIFLVGKGITYDTGGADVKAGGVMAGMHRDKCGAAAVTGFFKTLALLKPERIKVVGYCAFVRNSIGEDSYVADEIIVSRAGVRVRVGNTDAEGRMAMTDILCKAKEEALNAKNPKLHTVATLTGHVIRAYGEDYTAVLSNGPGRKEDLPKKLQLAGDCFAEPCEISTIRREDFNLHKGPSEYEEVLQCNNLPSSQTSRGHQTPAAFMQMASGLDKHGLDSDKPLAYTHLDCAGSAGRIYIVPTAAPLLALFGAYVWPRL